MSKKRFFFIILTLLFVSLGKAYANDSFLKDVFNQQKSDAQVQGTGRVIKLLADDNQGSRHQRFLLRLESGQTILIAHNIDLAAKITHLNIDDVVEFYGEYEWNTKGGLVHWTHLDPNNRHVHGWLIHNGITYQ